MKVDWRPIILVLLSCICLSVSQKKESLTPTKKNPCIGQKMCGDCVGGGKDCAWCQAPNYDAENKERCNLKSEHANCPTKDLIFPSSVLEKTVNNVPKDGTKTENPIQLQPQVIQLKMRPNDPQKFTLNFRLADNYPVDLYYLMDLSYSMKDDKEKLATLGVLIANEMNNITQNFRLGFGSFVDKVVMPYVSMAPNKSSGTDSPTLNNPCKGCEPAYGFKNQLPLNDDPSVFQTKVQNAKVSGNLDAPEGGLDAVMQAISCESQIGWRNPSRRMLLYSTDAGFHFAGDGKLGGIIKPNDGECHLVNGIYTESTKQDYPSISQIAAKIEEKNVNLIFAVTEKQVRVYSQLKNFIPGSETGRLADDSSNIVDLVRDNYRKITSKVEMSSVGAEDVIIRYFSKCKDKTGELIETNVCEGLKVGDSVSFDVEIEVKECPVDSTGFSRKFDIKPVGLSDKLEIRMELICKCDCENPTISESRKKNKNCNYHGTFVCGTCDCEDKYYGKTCDCYTGNVTQTEKEDQCIAKNSTLICSGRGECVCGNCECKPRRGNSEEKYSGKWCQCDDYSCPFHDNALCGGPDHGTCQCSKCNCTSNYTGENCGCSTGTDKCLASDGTLCGGIKRGSCQCNKCVCNPDSKYQGTTCEDCKDCPMVCRQNKECVQCVAYGTGKKKDNCQECKARNYISKEDVLSDGYNSCEFKDDDDCIFYFTYNYDDDNELKIVAQSTKECPAKVNVLAIVLGVVIGIVVVGLALLLIWKLVTTISDRRELARFEKETKDAKWDTGENPVYKPATSTYKNPTYAGK